MSPPKRIPPDLVARLIDLVAGHALTDKDDLTRYTTENRDIYHGFTPLVLQPASTREVSQILALAYAENISVVPQGGLTGHVGGAIPSGEIVLSCTRLDKIRTIDPAGEYMIAEAGVILQNACEHAQKHERLFPLSLASGGSCQIGGNIATNAGGYAVLAYGNMRDLVLGLEVVLADGQIWDGLRRLRKDNSGYDLKHLFIGSEGTLGIICAAVLKLFPLPAGRVVGFGGLARVQDALKILAYTRKIAGHGHVSAFELLPQQGIDFVLRNIAGTRHPLGTICPWYVLVEISGYSEQDARDKIESCFANCYEEDLLVDAVIAGNLAQQQALWRLRETLPEAQKFAGASIKHDISVACCDVPGFLDAAEKIIAKIIPKTRICAFGHLGDGNIHYNLSPAEDMRREEFLAHRENIQNQIHALVLSMGGSIAAEHGIGQLKRDLLARVKGSVEMGLMRQIKHILDPKGILNPGKVL